MANTSEFTGTLPKITAGGSSSEIIDKLNAPLNVIEEHLNTLASRIVDAGHRSAIVCSGVPLGSDVAAGDLVYFNTENQRFEKAQALILPEQSEGKTVEAPQARVEGMVVQIDTEEDNVNNVIGNLLIVGYWEDTNNLLASCIGADYLVPGTYYLSETSPGKAVLDPGEHLRQPVLSNYGGGRFCMQTFYMAHDNHIHASHELGPYWVKATSLPDDVEIPEGAKWRYNKSMDGMYDRLGKLSDATTAVFLDGILQEKGKTFVFDDDNYVWCTSASAPAATSTVTLFNFYPFAYGSPVVRSIKSANDMLTVKNVDGDVVLVSRNYTTGTHERSSTAVASINGDKINYTPVVTAIAAGPGIQAVSDDAGGLTLSTTEFTGGLLDAYSINHNQTNLTSDGRFMYITYPKGRSASLTMTLPITFSRGSKRMLARVWCCGVDSSASFNIQYFNTPVPEAGEALPTWDGAEHADTLDFASSQGNVAYAESANGYVFTGDGLLTATVSIAAPPASDIRLLRIGFKITMIADEAEASPTVITNAIDAVVRTAYCDGSISAFTCVRPTANGLVACGSGDVANADTCVGLAIEDSIIDPDTMVHKVRYVLSGVIESDTFNYTPGQPLWLGTDGKLTTQRPMTNSSARFSQRIGVAVAGNAIQVVMEPAYIKE